MMGFSIISQVPGRSPASLATEKVLGSNAVGAVGSITSFGGTVGNSGLITATWSGASSTTSITKGYMKMDEWDTLPADFKLLIWDSSNVFLGASDALTITSAMTGAYQEFNFSTPVTGIAKGTDYQYGYVASTSRADKCWVDSGLGTSARYGTAGTYASPGNYSNIDVTNTGTLCIYFTGLV